MARIEEWHYEDWYYHHASYIFLNLFKECEKMVRKEVIKIVVWFQRVSTLR